MLKKIFIAFISVLLMHSLAFSLQLGSAWQKFNSPEGKFNILLPKKPDVEVKDVDTDLGKVTQYSYSFFTNAGYFQVTYADYPVVPETGNEGEVLDAVREGVMESLQGELVSQKNISLHGYPGREFSAKKVVEGTNMVFNWRIFLVGRRLYQLAAATSQKDAASADVTRFLTSFDLNK